jgi:hypothetical protein
MSFSKNLAVLLMVVSQKVYSLARRAQWFLASTRGLVVVSWRVTIGRVDLILSSSLHHPDERGATMETK